MDATYTLDPRMVGTGLLIGRLVLGLIMAAHGAQKLFGWFGGYGLNATGVAYGERLSPRVMTDVLDVTGRAVAEYVAGPVAKIQEIRIGHPHLA